MSTRLLAEYQSLANYSMLRNSDEVIYDNAPEAHGFRHVYVFTVVLAGHVACACDRSKRICFVRWHNASEGTWPVHRSVNDVFAEDLIRMIGTHYRCCSHAFALMRR